MSPFISPDEAAVRDVALREGLPMIYILDNGLPIGAKYKPPGSLIEAIAEGRLLLLSPWPHPVPNKGRCSRAECTAMNAMAEAIANAEVRNAEVRNAEVRNAEAIANAEVRNAEVRNAAIVSPAK